MHASVIFGLSLTVFTSVRAVPFPSVTVSQDHYQVLAMRGDTTVDPTAVTDTDCVDPTTNIVFHDQNVAELAICGGIAGAITQCQGAPLATNGSSGTALFELTSTVAGATINISKGRWEGCVRAARAVCPTGDLDSTCIGGASTGDVDFSLSAQ